MLVRQSLLVGLGAFVAANASTPAYADWYEAQSDHFVIYADDSEKDVQRFAEMLEQYHAALRYVTGGKYPTPSPSNRVTIYAVGDQKDIRTLMGTDSRVVAGFYLPRASGSVAFVQDIKLKSGYPAFSTVILLHEYAHHFLMSASRFAMPSWMNEGGAEFFASAGFARDGSVSIGRPAQHRAGDLAYADEVTVEELVDPDLYAERRSGRFDAFYARSWLLYHYLTFSEDRAGQLKKYSQAITNGASSPVAAREAFGDLDELERELDRYLRQRRMYQLTLGPDRIQIGPISVRRLSEGEEEMMPAILRSRRGVNEEQAQEVLAEARAVAASFPDNAYVLAALSEAEHDAGNFAESIAAADRAIALNPSIKNAYVQKGYSLFRLAEDADDRDAAYSAAMKPFEALNALENDHPMPLIYYYRSYAERGLQPPENARHALERAYQLAPFDDSLAMNVAVMQATEGKTDLAAYTLAPLAADPHGGRMAARAKDLIDALKRAPEGEPFDFSTVIETVQVETPDIDDSGS